jgi:hypothetical protein
MKLDGDAAALQAYAGLLDEFDRNFESVSPWGPSGQCGAGVGSAAMGWLFPLDRRPDK